MNIPTDLKAFNESGVSLESKSLGFFMKTFMVSIMNIIMLSSNCLFKLYLSEGTLFLSFFSDADVNQASDDFYGFYKGQPMNAKSLALGPRPTETVESSSDFTVPKIHMFGCFKDSTFKAMNVTKAMSLFMDHCAVFLALANPIKALNFGIELQHKIYSVALVPWKGQRRFKCTPGEERYGIVSSSSSSLSLPGSAISFQDLFAVKTVKFVSGFSFLDSCLDGPCEVFELNLGSRASSPLFMTQYVFHKDNDVFYRLDSSGTSSKFDESTFKRALSLVSSLSQKHFGIAIWPGIYYSKSSELFELGICGDKQILGLNTFSRDLQDAPDVESFLVTMCADYLDKTLNLGSLLVRYVSLRQPPNMDMCVECMSRGTLLCCDKCPRSYCLSCLDLDTMPETDIWECPKHRASSGAAAVGAAAAGAPAADTSKTLTCSTCACAIPQPDSEPKQFGLHKDKLSGLKRPRPVKPSAGAASAAAAASASSLAEAHDLSSWQFETAEPDVSLAQTDAYLMSMMPHAYGGDEYAGAGHFFAPAEYSGGAYSESGGQYGSEFSAEAKAKKPRPKAIKKPRKDEDNLLKQAFDVILETSPAVEIPTVYPVLHTPFFGMSADDTYKHFPSGMPYVRETVKQAILNKKFKIAKPGNGASAGGNVREIGPKISWLQRDLEVCALLGFCAHDVYELYLESDEQARQREGTSSRGVCFVFKK